jgi:hypothetical protein
LAFMPVTDLPCASCMAVVRRRDSSCESTVQDQESARSVLSVPGVIIWPWSRGATAPARA